MSMAFTGTPEAILGSFPVTSGPLVSAPTPVVNVNIGGASTGRLWVSVTPVTEIRYWVLAARAPDKFIIAISDVNLDSEALGVTELKETTELSDTLTNLTFVVFNVLVATLSENLTYTFWMLVGIFTAPGKGREPITNVSGSIKAELPPP